MRKSFSASLCASLSLLALVIFAGVPSTAHAAPPPEFETGNQRYDKGDFQGASAAYESAVKTGNFSANLFFNLANADYRLGKKGAAFVAYERALALEPSHPEAKANLNLLRNETGARLPTPSWLDRLLLWPDEATRNRAAWLAAIAFWVLCFSLTPAFTGSGSASGRSRVAWLPAVLSVLVLGWSVAAIVLDQAKGPTWIVTDSQAAARVAPADGSKLAAALPMGSHVQLLLERGPWLYIVLPDSDGQSRGWIARSSVEPIAIGKS